MGIKGIYRELGPGQRISLAKLATEHLETTGRPLRLAVDIAIWQFQNQAAKGGSNPAIRTLFYRLVRLLGHAIQPIFVFDGPEKPQFKRNKRAGRGDGVASAMAKRLIRLFGLPVHQAPGEAEAECALLQQQGIVDAVLSEDVDTLMFGCTRTLRNWTAEGSRGSKTPTHVTMYNAHGLDVVASPGLDREGMVLVAMMSGGDYIPAGVPGCGVKLACEIARAGFGKSLCRLRSNGRTELDRWRASLRHELATNESKFFRTRHKALVIPESFPDLRVLRHYTHPAVSPQETVERLKSTVRWDTAVDVVGLREFVGDTFGWTFRIGAIKLIRVLSPTLLAQKLLQRSASMGNDHDLVVIEEEEHRLVKAITGKRAHFSVDAMPELRVSYVPAAVVHLDLSEEADEVIESGIQGLALNSDEEFGDQASQVVDDGNNKMPKRVFDPATAHPVWLPESLVKLGAPLTVQDWEEAQQAKLMARKEKKPTWKEKNTSSGDKREVSSLDRWLRATKNLSQHTSGKDHQRQAPKLQVPEPILPLATTQSGDCRTQSRQPVPSFSQRRALHTETISSRSKPSKPATKAPATAAPSKSVNPWARNGSQNSSRVDRPKRAPESIVLPSSSDRGWCAPCPPHVSATHHFTHNSATGVPSHADLALPEPDTNRSMRKEGSCEGETSLQLSPSKSPRKGNPRQTSITSFIRFTPDISDVAAGARSPAEHHLISIHDDETLFTGTCPSESIKDNTLNQKDSTCMAVTRQPDAMSSCHEQAPGSPAMCSRLTKVYVPRVSAVGFVKEVQINEDEAEKLLTESAQPGGKSRRAWRQSRVSLIDLTDDT